MEKTAKNNEKMKKTRSIKTKIIGFILPVVALMMLVIVLSNYFVMEKIIISNSQKNLKAESSAITSEVKSWVNGNMGKLESIYNTLQTVPMTDDELMEYLKSTCGLDKCMPNGVYLAVENGEYYDSTWVPDESWDPTTRDWYIEGASRDTLGIGMPYIDADSGSFVVSVSGTVTLPEQGKAVMSVDIFLADISEYIAQYSVMDTGYSFLIEARDNRTDILAHLNGEYQGTSVSELPSETVEAACVSYLNSEEEVLAQVSVGKEKYMLVVDNVPETSWKLVSCVKESDLLQVLDEIKKFSLITIILSLLVIGIVIERLTHMIAKPINLLTKNIEQITQGDFTVEVITKSKDEVGVMARGLKRLTKVMRQMLTDMAQISSSLDKQATGSSEVSLTLYNSASQQALSMKELSETVEALSISVDEVANGATRLAQIVADTNEKGDVVSEKMQETVHVTEKGKKDMDEIRAGMSEVESAIISLEQVVTRVGESTQEITHFVELIGEIATQTNLLSLNASIEAARAGESGRGFAVVAGEIGKLAEDSAQSVEKISQITNDIQGQVSETVRKTKDSVDKIKNSSEKIIIASTTFEDIFTTISETSHIVGEMVAEVHSVDEVATNLASITEEQSASSEEILATAESMANLAEDLTNNSQNVADDAEKLAETVEKLEEHMKQFVV